MRRHLCNQLRKIIIMAMEIIMVTINKITSTFKTFPMLSKITFNFKALMILILISQVVHFSFHQERELKKSLKFLKPKKHRVIKEIIFSKDQAPSKDRHMTLQVLLQVMKTAKIGLQRIKTRICLWDQLALTL
jgi:hypothetical protein